MKLLPRLIFIILLCGFTPNSNAFNLLNSLKRIISEVTSPIYGIIKEVERNQSTDPMKEIKRQIIEPIQEFVDKMAPNNSVNIESEVQQRIINPIESLVNEVVHNEALMNAIATALSIPQNHANVSNTTNRMSSNLNFDCLVLIFDHLSEFEDFLNAARVNQNFKLAAGHVFKLKYTKQIQITDGFQIPREPVYIGDLKIDANQVQSIIEHISNYKLRRDKYETYNSSIKLIDYQTIVDTFNYLEVSSLKLIFNNYNDRQPARLLNQLISSHSSLEAISFETSYVNPLDFITQPLANVKSVTFCGPAQVNGDIPLSINEIFPAMDALYFDMEVRDLDYINCHMPNLKHIEFRSERVYYQYPDYTIPKPKGMATNTTFVQILEKNPQIESAFLVYTKPEDLVAASQLTDLKNLTIVGWYNYTDRHHEITFETVTQFNAKRFGDPPLFSFPNLRNFHLELMSRSFLIEWSNFVGNHSHITELHLEYFKNYVKWDIDRIPGNPGGANDDRYDVNDFVEIVALLPNLNLLTVECRNWNEFEYRYGINNVVSALNAHENLNRFELILNDRNSSHWEKLGSSIQQDGGEWLIQNTDTGFALERL